MEITRVLSVLAALFSDVLTMGVPNLNWFQAQERCNGSGLTTETTGISSEYYWTGRYKRLSTWINIIGCYADSFIKNHTRRYETEMDTKSVGACQDICSNENSSTFALKLYRCTCLKGEVKFDSLSEYPPSLCNFSCDSIDGIYSGECGGKTAQNVYLSDKERSLNNDKKDNNCMVLQCPRKDKKFIKKDCSLAYAKICKNPNASKEGNAVDWKNSMKGCKDSNFTSYLYGKLNLEDAIASCKSLPQEESGLRWVGIARQSYMKLDQGRTIGVNEKEYFLLCQKCKTGTNCTFCKCTDKIQNEPECSVISTEATMTTKSYTANNSVPQSLITKEMTTSLDFTNGKGTSTSKQSMATSSFQQISTTDVAVITSKEQEISTEINTSTTSFTSQERGSSNRNGKDDAIISVPIIVGIVIAAIIIVLTVVYIRRRKLGRKLDDNKNPPNLNGISNGTYPEASNQQSDSYFVIEKLSSYELDENCVIVPESPHIETEEGEYDHLRNKDSRKKDTDDTYHHVTPVSTGFVSNYDFNYDFTTSFQKQGLKNTGSKINKSKHEMTPQLESVNSTYSEVDNPSQGAYFVLEKASSYELADSSVLNSESPYNETEEGDYDQLRHKDSRKKETDDTYHHATFDSNKDMSDYDTSNADQTQELENTYDHMHESLNLQSDPDYGYDSIDPNIKH